MALPPPRSSSGSMQHRWINHKFGSLQNQTADGLVTAVAEIYEMHAAMEVWEANLASLLKAK
jgi:hypothetical protein